MSSFLDRLFGSGPYEVVTVATADELIQAADEAFDDVAESTGNAESAPANLPAPVSAPASVIQNLTASLSAAVDVVVPVQVDACTTVVAPITVNVPPAQFDGVNPHHYFTGLALKSFLDNTGGLGKKGLGPSDKALDQIVAASLRIGDRFALAYANGEGLLTDNSAEV